MDIIFMDFETIYDDEYSLRKMTPIEYVLDPRFECHGCAIKEGRTGTPFWVDGPDLPAYFARKDPNNTMVVTHNALFDMCIVVWKYKFIPKLSCDTLGVSRALLGHMLRSVSLNSVALHLGLGAKTQGLTPVKGLPLEVIKQNPILYKNYTEYACIDVELCAGIFEKLVVSGQFPVTEMVIMDMIIRCTTQPQFLLDQTALAEHLNNVLTEKQEVLSKAMLLGAEGTSTLRSNDAFAQLLGQYGIDPPTKISPATGKVMYAFAKTDPDFLALAEHDNPAVQVLVEARLGSKSTIEETRTERLISIAQLQWPDWVTRGGNAYPGWCPVPLKFSGAHTHRFSGDWKLNLQNLPTRGGRNQIRKALKARQGYKVVTADSAQIQARLVAWLCRQEDLLQQFANNEDVYSIFASEVFQQHVDRKMKDANGVPVPEQVGMGFVGKTGILSLGFGVGHVKFLSAVRSGSVAQLGYELPFTDEDSIRTVNTYRAKYSAIKRTWSDINYQGIQVMFHGKQYGSFTLGPCDFDKGRISLPNGLHLKYHNLQQGDDGWQYTYAGIPKRTYGGSILENLAQALEQCIIMEAARRIEVRRDLPCKVRLALQGHDELVYIVPEQHTAAIRPILEYELNVRPEWAPDLPLSSETGEGDTYGDAK